VRGSGISGNRVRRARHAARLAPLAIVVMVAAAVAAPAYGNHSAPATYTGTAAGGGTVEFDVSADGSSVTRFAVANVSTTCGAVSVTSTGNVPITNHSFNWTSGQLHYSGSFPAVQQASGSLSLHLSGYPSCTSDPVSWTATTTAPPPAGVPVTPGPTPGTGQSAHKTCVNKANKAFRKARRAARKAKATTKQGKRRAARRLKRAAQRRRGAIRSCARLL
jgi:hypothetical protein